MKFHDAPVFTLFVMLMHLWQWIQNKKVSWGQVDFFVKTCHMSFIYIFTNGFFSIDLFNTVKGNIVSNECTCASAATTIVQPYLFCQFWFLCVLIGCGERNFFCYRKEKLYFLLCNIYPLWKLLYFKHFFNIFMGKWYISKQW